jgi:hypothetical protein
MEVISPYFGVECGFLVDAEWPASKGDREVILAAFDIEIPFQLMGGIRYKISDWLRIYGEFRFESTTFDLFYHKKGKVATGYGFILLLPGKDNKNNDCPENKMSNCK